MISLVIDLPCEYVMQSAHVSSSNISGDGKHIKLKTSVQFAIENCAQIEMAETYESPFSESLLDIIGY